MLSPQLKHTKLVANRNFLNLHQLQSFLFFGTERLITIKSAVALVPGGSTAFLLDDLTLGTILFLLLSSLKIHFH